MTHCATATVKSLKCSLNRKEREVVPQGRCQVIYTIKQNEDESQTWSLSEPIDSHSHPISKPVIQSVPEDSHSAEASSSSIEIVEPNSPLPAHASDSQAARAFTASQTFDYNVSLQDESTVGVSVSPSLVLFSEVLSLERIRLISVRYCFERSTLIFFCPFRLRFPFSHFRLSSPFSFETYSRFS